MSFIEYHQQLTSEPSRANRGLLSSLCFIGVLILTAYAWPDLQAWSKGEQAVYISKEQSDER